MSLISDRMSCIKPSPTLEVSRLAAQLVSQGVDVISLGAGEPDFDTPDHVKHAAIDAIHAGKTKYTPVDGTQELKEAVLRSIEAEYGVHYKINQVLVGSGAKQCIYNLFMATLNPGDEVIVPAPYWVSYPDIVQMCGGTPVVVNCDETFKLTAESLEAAITPKTKWLIINSPSNPTGVVYGRDDLRSIADVLLKHPKVHVMTDDIYAKLIYDDAKFFNILQVESGLYDRVFIINGVSKSYAMTGWRIGYVAGNVEVIRAISTIQSQSTTNANSIAQAAAVAALSGSDDFLKDRLRVFSERRDMAMAAIKNSKILSATLPQGAFYIFVSCKGVIGKKTEDGVIANGADFSKYLLKHKVAVVPGDAFGAPDFFRISYALSNERLQEACDRIIAACAALN
ncbi:MAG: pyridoxal phosphate-dependent aminotransferase [Anaplasma sp.]